MRLDQVFGAKPRPKFVTVRAVSPRRAMVLTRDVCGRAAALVLEEEPEREDRR